MENLKLNKSNSPIFVSVLLFVFFVAVFSIFYSTTTNSIETNSVDIFNGEVARTEQGLSNYLIFYGNMIGSLKGFFEGSQAVEEAEFKNFVKDVSLTTGYKPISSFLYLEKVKKDDTSDFFKEISKRPELSAGFDSAGAIKALNPYSSEYFLLKYSEPNGLLSEILLGVDFAEIHPSAFNLAIENNKPTITRIFVNPYSNKNEITIFAPVYNVGASEATVEDRKKNIVGLVAITFKTKDLLDGVFLPGSPDRLISTDVFEGSAANPSNLIYSNAIYPIAFMPDHVLTKTIQVGGRPWTIKFSTTPRFTESISQKNVSVYIILAGLLISLGISLIAYFILSSRNRAIKLAEIMTADLEKSESDLRRSNRTINIIREADELIVRSKDEEKLLHDVCNTLIRNAGYRLVWIGYVEYDEAKTVRVASWAGHSDGYIENLNVSWSEDSPRGMGPTGRSIRENRIIVTPDFSKDTGFAPWLEEAKKRGYIGSVVIPLLINEEVMGVLNIYSSEPDTFREDEVKMLREFGEDVSYSINNIRTAVQKEKAEKSLRESERILSEYMLNSPIYTFIKEATPDGEMKVLMASSNYEEMIGSTGKNMEGKTMHEIFPKDFADKITKDDLSVLKSGKVLKLDEDLNGRNYTTIKFPIVLENRRLLAGYTIDITDRKKAELAIKESEKRFRNYFELPLVGRAITSPEKGWVEVNDKLCEILGYSKEELAKKTWAEMTYPEDLAPDLEKFNRVVSGEIDDYTLEKRFIHKDGHIVYTNLSVQAVRNADRSLNYIIALLFDITDRKLAEKELVKKMEELQQFRSAVDNASDHIIITDSNAKIVYANSGAEKVTGYSIKELVGSTPALWGGQMPKEFYEKMWHSIKVDKQPFVGELRNKKKNGQIYDAQFSISPILSDKGEIIYFVGVERDITKAKEIERSKNEFVSLASHQLRTPLTAINWYAEMLLGGDAGKLSAKQQDYVKELHGSSKRMTDLVSALLNVSRIDLGTFTINPQPTDVINITKGVIKDLFVRINKKNLKIAENYEKLEKINADPNLLTIILQNLISNAVKYTAENGIVDISIGKDGPSVKMVVKDNGYGIPLYQQDRVFEKFFRGDNIVPVETDGNGLGLYMVKQILDSVGGSISFVSKEGEGTTFTVKIPASGVKGREGTRILEQKGFGV